MTDLGTIKLSFLLLQTFVKLCEGMLNRFNFLFVLVSHLRHKKIALPNPNKSPNKNMLARFSFFNFRHFSIVFAIDGSKQNQKIQKIDEIQTDSGLKSWSILHLPNKQNKKRSHLSFSQFFGKMNTERFLDPLSTQEANLATKSFSEARSNEVQVEEVTINNAFVYGVYTIFVLTGTVFLLAMLNVTCRFKHDKIAKSFKQFSQIPCLTSFVLIGTMIFLKLLKTGKHGIEKIADPVKHFSRIPCRKCRFFSGNPYIKCAVHPSTVLTTQAKDCSDYWSLNGKFPR
jgi:hypothetical protein